MLWVLALLAVASAGCSIESPASPAPSLAAAEQPTPTGEPAAASSPTPIAASTAGPVPFWERQGHVNPVAHLVAALFNIDEDPEPFGPVLYRNDAAAAEALHGCFDVTVRQWIDSEIVDGLYDDPTSRAPNIEAIRADGAEALLECVDPLLVRDEWIATSVAGWNIYGPVGANLGDHDPCMQQGYSPDATEFRRQWLGELRDERPSEVRVCQESTPGWTSPIDAVTAQRFCIEACQRNLADVFVPLDATNASGQARDLSMCLHRALRREVGNETVDLFASFDVPSPERDDAVRAASTVLFECVPGDQIRAAAIATEVDAWNTYVRPSGTPPIERDDPCVQQLYPVDLIAFRDLWIDQLEVGNPDVRAGTCLRSASVKELVALPAVAPQPDAPTLGARHPLTLQWISWEPDQWGAIEVTPNDDGTYRVQGRQDGPDGDYVSLQGTIVVVDPAHLRFDGVVETRISHINAGTPCVRAGEVDFVATGDRRFWRMQDLINCDGAVTDYVDIYFE